MASGTSVSYQYPQDGSYTVTLTVFDNNPEGCSGSTSILVQVLGENLIVDQTQFTVEELIQDVLIGNECSRISNVVFSTGSSFGADQPNGIGYFQYTGNDFPFSEGIVLSTGEATDAGGPNEGNLSAGSWQGDVDLESTIPGVESNDATFIAFDFVPVINEISFNFLMASEEYDQGNFECEFSDAFAFLLTDSQGVTTNLAVLPGTNAPILVTNIHPDNGVCGAANEEYFGEYIPQNGSPIAYDGRTIA